MPVIQHLSGSEALPDIPASAKPEVYVLSRSIPAIPLLPDTSGHIALGAISKLPAGVEVQVCGEGFNPSTLKVHWEGGACFVFLQDLRGLGRRR
jgi:hypothetical protein